MTPQGICSSASGPHFNLGHHHHKLRTTKDPFCSPLSASSSRTGEFRQSVFQEKRGREKKKQFMKDHKCHINSVREPTMTKDRSEPQRWDLLTLTRIVEACDSARRSNPKDINRNGVLMFLYAPDGCCSVQGKSAEPATMNR